MCVRGCVDVSMSVRVCVSVRACVCVGVCVCVRERERERAVLPSDGFMLDDIILDNSCYCAFPFLFSVKIKRTNNHKHCH